MSIAFGERPNLLLDTVYMCHVAYTVIYVVNVSKDTFIYLIDGHFKALTAFNFKDVRVPYFFAITRLKSACIGVTYGVQTRSAGFTLVI